MLRNKVKREEAGGRELTERREKDGGRNYRVGLGVVLRAKLISNLPPEPDTTDHLMLCHTTSHALLSFTNH